MAAPKKIFKETIQTDHKVITEELSKGILEEYGVSVPPYALATTAKEAVKAAKRIGFPVVMKVVSPKILHKTDVGGVKVGISKMSEVRKTFADMKKRLNKKGSGFKGILLEKMVPKGVELIVGVQNDPQFGPVIMVGMGGIMTEVMKDVAFRMLPITQSDAKSMLAELKGAALLDGFRGSDPVDKREVARMLTKIGKMAMDNADYINSIDFNPVVVYPDSHYVVDAKIILNDEVRAGSVSKAKPDKTHMEEFFTPKSIALVGASSTPGKIGNSILDSLVNYDYKGKVYPVNPKVDEIFGHKCYKSIREIPGKVDMVVVSIDLSRTPGRAGGVRREGHTQRGDSVRRRKGAGRREGRIRGPGEGALRAARHPHNRPQLHRHVQRRQPAGLRLPGPGPDGPRQARRRGAPLPKRHHGH